MIQREISAKTLQYANQYPVVTITGPRQSGKTTLCKMFFQEKAYVSLENLDDRQFAKNDPRGFLARFPKGAVIDEIQRVPELLSYIQSIVDETQTEGFLYSPEASNLNCLKIFLNPWRVALPLSGYCHLPWPKHMASNAITSPWIMCCIPGFIREYLIKN